MFARKSLFALDAITRDSIVLCKGLRSPAINMLNITNIMAIIAMTKPNSQVTAVL
jgi:hypothetical protein